MNRQVTRAKLLDQLDYVYRILEAVDEDAARLVDLFTIYHDERGNTRRADGFSEFESTSDYAPDLDSAIYHINQALTALSDESQIVLECYPHD